MTEAASVPWLLRQELRLLWRGSALGRARGTLLLAGLACLAQGLGLAVAYGLTHLHPAAAELPLTLSLALVFITGLMLAQAIQRATELLDGHADLGWLLSSPVPPARILALRLLSMAAGVGLNWLVMLGPVATGLALLGHPAALALLPVIACLALLVASAGLALTFLLLRVAGPRRTRALANLTATLIGAAIFLGAQWRTLLTPPVAKALWRHLSPDPTRSLSGPLWLPARALLGDMSALLPIAVVAILAATAAAWALGRWFASGAADAASLGAHPGTSGAAPRRFGGGQNAAALRKEILILRRTPGLAGLALYYTIYLIPAGAVIWRGGDMLGARPLAAAPVLAAGELARLFMSACMRGEAATDLVATAPITPRAIDRAKLQAATLGAASLLGLPILGIAVLLPGAIPALAIGLAGVVFCNLCLGLWRPVPIRRQDLRRERTGWGGLANFVGLLFSAAWSTTAWLLLKPTAWAIAPAALALGVLWLVRPNEKRKAKALAPNTSSRGPH